MLQMPDRPCHCLALQVQAAYREVVRGASCAAYKGPHIWVACCIILAEAAAATVYVCQPGRTLSAHRPRGKSCPSCSPCRPSLESHEARRQQAKRAEAKARSAVLLHQLRTDKDSGQTALSLARKLLSTPRSQRHDLDPGDQRHTRGSDGSHKPQ